MIFGSGSSWPWGLRARRQGRPAWWPDHFGALDTEHILKPSLSNALAKGRNLAITCIPQEGGPRDLGLQLKVHQCQGDLLFLLKDHILWHSRVTAAPGVIGPFLGQVKAVGDGQARMVVDQGDADRILAIGLFA